MKQMSMRPVAFIAGDRQSDGIFNLWSIASNITIRSLRSLLKRGLIDSEGENRLAAEWKNRMGIRTPDMNNNILTLSGGNQQKTLFARALGSEADDHPHGRSHARRRYWHQARSL